MAGLHHRVDEEDDDGDDDEGVEEVRVAGDAREALGAARELEAEDRVDVEHHDADDLGEAKRDDGQVVALESQRGNADEKTADRGADAAEEQTEREEHDRRGRDLGHRGEGQAELVHVPHDEEGAGVAAHGHEARMAERQLPEVARGDVERHRHDDVDADLLEDARLVARHDAAADHRLSDDEEEDDEHGVDGIASRHGQRAIDAALALSRTEARLDRGPPPLRHIDVFHGCLPTLSRS